MAALDFPNSPTVGATYTAPNGAVYTWDGAAWTVSGVISTGTAAGGSLAGTYPNPAIAAGAVTWANHGDLQYARVTRLAGLPTLTTGVLTALTFDTVGVNQGGMFTLSAPDRFTIQETGFYVIGGSIEWSPVASASERWLFITLGGAPLAGAQGAAYWVPMEVMTGQYLSAGNALQLNAQQDTGASLALVATHFAPNFWIARVG